MTDTFSKEKRHEIMAANRSRGNQSTELRLADLLTASGISGWRVHAPDVLGKPDFAFDAEKVAVFVDGCFWHGCSKCRSLPKSNPEYWATKIAANQARDRRVARTLRQRGWRVIRIWEHELKKRPNIAVRRIARKIEEVVLAQQQNIQQPPPS